MPEEATLQFNGEVNKQNCKIWSQKNPHVIEKVSKTNPIAGSRAGSIKEIIGSLLLLMNNDYDKQAWQFFDSNCKSLLSYDSLFLR